MDQESNVFIGKVPVGRYPYRLFLLVSFLSHLLMFFLIQHWVGFEGPVAERSVDLIELVRPETPERPGSLTKKGGAILFGTENPADLEGLPRGEETRLPPIPKSTRPGIPGSAGKKDNDLQSGRGASLRHAKSPPPGSSSKSVAPDVEPPPVNARITGPIQKDRDVPLS